MPLVVHTSNGYSDSNNQQIIKKALREAFNEFSEVYAEMAPDIKRRILNVVGEENHGTMKRGENTGEIFYNLHGDGSVKVQ